jgi:hypothetical protein
MQRSDVIRRRTQLRINLELENCRDKVLDVILIRYDVVFCTRIKVLRHASVGRDNSLKAEPHVPPSSVHTDGTLLEDVPAPLREGEKLNFKTERESLKGAPEGQVLRHPSLH